VRKEPVGWCRDHRVDFPTHDHTASGAALAAGLPIVHQAAQLTPLSRASRSATRPSRRHTQRRRHGGALTKSSASARSSTENPLVRKFSVHLFDEVVSS